MRDEPLPFDGLASYTVSVTPVHRGGYRVLLITHDHWTSRAIEKREYLVDDLRAAGLTVDETLQEYAKRDQERQEASEPST